MIDLNFNFTLRTFLDQIIENERALFSLSFYAIVPPFILRNHCAVNTPELGMAMSKFMSEAFMRVRMSGLISVCLLNGTAVGGGAEIATVCDYR